MLRPLPALTAILALLMVAAVASAHGPPTKRDQDFRLLTDHNDDCGGDSASTLTSCRGTHDLIGLDLLERHDGGLGDVVVFRFVLNGGSGNLKDVLTLKVDGTTKTFELKTSNNDDFTGTGFDAVGSKVDLNDNGRFIVEASVKRASLGGVGAKLTDYSIEAMKDSTKGDVMPGCYYNTLNQKVADAQCNSGDAEAPGTGFARTNGYVLTGPTYYVQVAMPASATVRADGEAVVEVGLTNAFRTTGQLATVEVGGADGFTATWVGANGADPARVDLLKGGSGTAELRLRGDGHAATTGTLTITVSTSLGGRSTHELPYEILAGENVGGPGTGHVDPTDDGKDSPAPVAPLVAFALLALVGLRRRA